MKKIFTAVFAALMMTVSPVMAENNNVADNSMNIDSHATQVMTTQSNEDDCLSNNEISVSVGFANAIQFGEGFFGALFGVKDKDMPMTCYNIDYSHRINKIVTVGATVNYFEGSKFSDSDKREKYYTVLPHVKVDYLNKKYFTLYGKVGAGFAVNKFTEKEDGKLMDKSRTKFAFQISPIGAEIGPNKHLRVFAELGFGFTGTEQIGIRYKF